MRSSSQAAWAARPLAELLSAELSAEFSFPAAVFVLRGILVESLVAAVLQESEYLPAAESALPPGVDPASPRSLPLECRKCRSVAVLYGRPAPRRCRGQEQRRQTRKAPAISEPAYIRVGLA